MRYLVGIALCACAGACGDDGGASNSDAAPNDVSDVPMIDADPRTTIMPGASFSIGPDDMPGRQDEDPSIVVDKDGSLYAFWYSNRGSAAAGRVDKQIYAIKSTDGAQWTAPVAISEGADYGFAPSVTPTATGFIATWWNWHNNVPGPGTTNWLLARTSTDGVTWSAPIETVTSGLGDWLPSVVDDPANGRVLVYFAAQARQPDGTIDGGQQPSHLFVVVKTGGTWGAVTPVAGVTDAATNQSYPFAIRRPDGTFAITWTRFTGANGNWANVLNPSVSTETWVATSTDGITFTNARVLSEGAGAEVDVFPALHYDHARTNLSVTWVTTDGAPSGHVVEMPFEGTYPTGRVFRANLPGYTPRVAATATPGVYWGVWVEGPMDYQRVRGVFFTK